MRELKGTSPLKYTLERSPLKALEGEPLWSRTSPLQPGPDFFEGWERRERWERRE